MVTGGGAHLQQTHTKKYLSSIYSSIILHHKSAAAVLVYVVDSNRNYCSSPDQHKPKNSSPSDATASCCLFEEGKGQKKSERT